MLSLGLDRGVSNGQDMEGNVALARAHTEVVLQRIVAWHLAIFERIRQGAAFSNLLRRDSYGPDPGQQRAVPERTMEDQTWTVELWSA